MHLRMFPAKWCYSEDEMCYSEDVPMSVIMLYQTYTLTSTMLTPCTLCTYCVRLSVTSVKALNLYFVWTSPNMAANHRQHFTITFSGLNFACKMCPQNAQIAGAYFFILIMLMNLLFRVMGKKCTHFQISKEISAFPSGHVVAALEPVISWHALMTYNWPQVNATKQQAIMGTNVQQDL